MRSIPYPTFFILPALLSACAPAPPETAIVEEQAPVIGEPAAPVPAPAATQLAPYDTSITIQTLMNSLIMPNVDQLWTAVSYVATEDGVTETQPDSDADWRRLRTSALTLIEAGNMLMIPGRTVMEPGAGSESGGIQLTGEEIAELVEQDGETWIFYAQQMQESTRRTLQAIELRDVGGLTEWGAEINEACEGCHAEFWYRPPGTMQPRLQVQEDPAITPAQP
jgi:hypothetical protein